VPELPDVDLYVEALAARVRGDPLVRVDLKTPFLLRTADPPLREAFGRRVDAVRRQGKRIVLALDGGLFLAIHLMIAGRIHWKGAGEKPGRGGTLLATFEFPRGSLTLTEAGTTRRAALHVVRADGLAALDRGGLEPLEAGAAAFRAALRRENHTLKRALTDPRILSGIGNAFSDEILHAARLSPVALTSRLADDEVARLHAAVRDVLGGWRDRLREEAAGRFPEGVTAFRPGFAVHGRHREPCPACGTAVQRIVHASSETNYCPRCQTGGKILSDRSLARLLGDDWPRTVDELERNPALGARPASPAGAPQRRRSPA
jgi:formamidopyrimidine-DNA glycosylase